MVVKQLTEDIVFGLPQLRKMGYWCTENDLTSTFLDPQRELSLLPPKAPRLDVRKFSFPDLEAAIRKDQGTAGQPHPERQFRGTQTKSVRNTHQRGVDQSTTERNTT